MGLKQEIEKSFDDILNEILTDLRNQSPETDTSQGTLVFMDAAALAAAKWGILQGIRWAMRQVFADTAETAQLEHWAWLFDINRLSGESDADMLARLLNRIQSPPAGGNQNDYEQWAKSITNVSKAYCTPLAGSLGTVSVLVVADATATGSEVPSSHTAVAGTNTSVTANKLVDSGAAFVADGIKPGDIVIEDASGAEAVVVTVDSATELTLDADIFKSSGLAYTLVSLLTQVKDYIMTVQPVQVHENNLDVIGPQIITQAVTMTVTGSGLNRTQIKADVEALVNSLAPGATLYRSALAAIAIQHGAQNAAVTTPAADVTATATQMIRPGTVTIG